MYNHVCTGPVYTIPKLLLLLHPAPLTHTHNFNTHTVTLLALPEQLLLSLPEQLLLALPKQLLLSLPEQLLLAPSSSPWPQWLMPSHTWAPPVVGEVGDARSESSALTRSELMQMFESHWKP